MAKYTLSALVLNQSGVLARVSGLFSRRGFNIESLAVGETENPELSRMTLRVDGDERTVEQLAAQLAKQYCVKTVRVLDGDKSVSRELVMLKVRADSRSRGDILQLASVFRARVVDVSLATLTLEMTGETDKIEALVSLMRDFGILELARTGIIALERGETTIHQSENGEAAR